MLGAILLAVTSFGFGIFAGGRIQLARGRLREARTGLLQIQNEISLEGAFAASLRQRQVFEAAGQTHHVRVINVVQFILTWNWDLSILLDLLRRTQEVWNLEAAWRRKLLVRTLALTAYETLTKLDWALDPAKGVRKTSLWRPLRALSLDSELSQAVLSMHKDVATVLANHGLLLQGIRNNIIGHRDNDVATQLLWMRKADDKEIEALGWELMALTSRILGAMNEVVKTLAMRHPPS